jgi:putative spermidine/putrescine transport system permease protein
MRAATASAVSLITAIALVPIAVLLVWSISRNWYWPALLPPEWSFRSWRYVFSPASEVGRAVATSASIAFIVALSSVGLGLPAARAFVFRPFRGKTLFLGCLLLPVIAPPVASILGLHRVFVSFDLTDRPAGVVLAHLMSAVPYATLMLIGSFRRLDRDLESQARTLGADKKSVWLHVILPSIAPGVAVALTFAFLVSWSQYLSTLLIGGGSVLTIPLEVVGFQRAGDEAIAAALSLVFLAPAVAVIAIVGRYLRP